MNELEKKTSEEQQGPSLESTRLSEEGEKEDAASVILSTTSIGYKQPERIFARVAEEYLLENWHFKSFQGP